MIDTLRTIFIAVVVLFFLYAGIRILMFNLREGTPPPRRPGGPGVTRESADTFGTSDMTSSDMTAAGFDSGGNDSGGGDSGGGWND